tara:strand:- start:215 stop:433 length:219 start_codon:yes stop_codon:yes gene_type:complete
MSAKIKLFSHDNKLIATTTVSDQNYGHIDCDEFIKNAWNMADKMAVHLSEGDFWRLSMSVDLDVRGEYKCTK